MQGGRETHSQNLEECYKLLKQFEEDAKKMRSWTLEADLSKVKKTKCKFRNDICAAIDEIEAMNMKKGYLFFMTETDYYIFFLNRHHTTS